MSGPRLILKQSTGWFAAGWQFSEALLSLSDGGFKLFAWLCLNADRHTGQMRITPAGLSSSLGRPAAWVESALEELGQSGVCGWIEAEVLEVKDRYWPYEKQPSRPGAQNYVAEVRRMLLEPACVRSNFTPADERLALEFQQRGISLEQLQWAIWLGCARKYMAMLNGQPAMPIVSLRYFTGLIDEVCRPDTPVGYWEHVRYRLAKLECQWLEQRRQSPEASQAG
jgi:hypothetical protein